MDEIEKRMRYVAPDEGRKLLHQNVTEAAIEFGRVIERAVPPGRGKSLALTKIEEARMWANQGIATSVHED